MPQVEIKGSNSQSFKDKIAILFKNRLIKATDRATKSRKVQMNRRELLGASGIVFVGSSLVSGRLNAARVPEVATMTQAGTQAPVVPKTGVDYNPVVTLNGWTLPWRMNSDGWKEFHLVAEPVEREIAPGMMARLWGYNGQSPGPTIEAVEGDKVRIFVTNKLPEHTTVHWHGMALAVWHGRRWRFESTADPTWRNVCL